MNEAAAASARDSLSRYEALLRVSRVLAGHTTVPELFGVLADRLHSVVPFDYLALVLHDPVTDSMRLVVLEGDVPLPETTTMPVAARGPAGVAWETQQPAVIRIPAEGPLPKALDYMRTQGRRVTCWLPLTTVHRRVGVLSFGSREAIDYLPDAVAFMEQVAAQVALAVDNAINFDRAREYEAALGAERDRLKLLLDLNNLLVTEHDYHSLHRAVSDTLNRIVPHDRLSITVHDKDVETPELDPMEPAEEWPSTCSVPLRTRRGEIGILTLSGRIEDAFSKSDETLLRDVSTQIAFAVESALAFRRIARLNERLVEEKHYLEQEVRIEHGFDEIIGRSPALKRVLRAVETVAPTDATVLLLGETGTGKELIARAIHTLSPRRAQSFVRFSGAALPTGLVESELFGHEKGAFTGALVQRLGRIEFAHRGTRFFDEVGDVPLDLQPKLLRVLQEREFERLGSNRTQRVDVRLVAATNRDLARMVEDGHFRSDLYYRLNVFPIVIPPLRDHPQDIATLAEHFAQKFARRLGRRFSHISESGMAALRAWHWPGNVRELENIIERAAILSPGPELLIPTRDLQPAPRRSSRRASAGLRDVERDVIVRALRESRGVVAGPSGAAARLGLSRTTLQSMMRRLGIRRPSF